MSLAARLLQTRWFVRAPIALFRLRLGFVFGGRLLLLEHLGRKSGLPRYVVLETVARTTKRHLVVAAGFGSRAQWFRNLQANPQCHVTVGFDYRRPAMARVLAADEASAVLADYRKAHPRAYAELSGVVEEAVGGRIEDVPLVELTLR